VIALAGRVEICNPQGVVSKDFFGSFFGSQDLISIVKNEYQLMSMMECGSELLRGLLLWAGRCGQRGHPPHYVSFRFFRITFRNTFLVQ